MKLPLPNSAVGRRIAEMPEVSKRGVIEKLHIAQRFSLKLDETKGDGKSQLFYFARFVAETCIIQQFLSCRELETTTTDSNIFDTVNCYFQDKNLYRSNCISVCINDAAAMTGQFEGFIDPSKGRESLFNKYSLLFTSQSSSCDKR
jgi:hypothetical protein